VLLLGVASCGRVIINTPMPRQGDDWDLTLTKVTDGPNSFNEGGSLIHKPADGDRFIFAHITLHNRSRAPRKFSFDRCDLDDGNNAVLPAIVSLAILNGDGNHEPELAADETIDRRVIFSYPEHRSPSRLRCAPMEFPLPQM
jgi:hypothetical protein